MEDLTLEQQLAQSQSEVEAAKQKVEFAERVMRLLNNSDFKAVIMDEFIVKEAANLVHQSADPILKPDQRADSLSMAQATGHLKRWLRVQLQIAEHARSVIAANEEFIEDLRAEIASNSEE